MKIDFSKLFLATAASSSLLLSYSANSFGGVTLDEIIVTAQKRSESLQDVPIAVSAFTGEDLTKFGLGDVMSVQLTTPGLVITRTGPVAKYILRGVGSGFSATGLEASIATYVDNRYVARSHGASFEFADVDRIEVLKGPQGTLYGRNATGGAIRVVTKGVSDELEGNLSASLGDYDYRVLSGTVSGPLTDTLGYRLTAMTKQRDAFADNIDPEGRSEIDDVDFQGYRGKLRWELSDNSIANLTLGYWKSEDTANRDFVDLTPNGLNTGLAMGGITTPFYSGKVATKVYPLGGSEEFSGELKFDVAFDSVDFASITTYADLDDAYPLEIDGTSGVALDSYASETEESISQEFQLLSNTEGDWEWILGAYYQNAKAQVIADAVVGPMFSVSTGVQSVKTTAWAVFGQTTWHLSEKWDLTLGGRYNYEEKDLAVSQSFGNGSPYFPLTIVPFPYEDNEDWTEFTPKIVLEYQLETGMAYLSYSRGFKSGGFNYPAFGEKILDPEILDAYEVGFKGELLDDKLRINTALFYYDYQDLQVQRQDQIAGITVENAANSTAIGLEADITWLATDRLQITAGFNVMDSEYDDYQASAVVLNAALPGNTPFTPGATSIPFNASGENLLLAADWSAFVSAEYEFDIGSGTVPIVMMYSYKDDYQFSFIADPLSAKALTQEGFGLLNARISYVPNNANWKVALWGNNITDEEYKDTVSEGLFGFSGSPSDPMTFGVDLTYDF